MHYNFAIIFDVTEDYKYHKINYVHLIVTDT